uniref:V-SNARE coiled-coil homology domain-containing protein n=1 Tax=Rhodosorus marinus TaxID=101924 RepID=A0A7S2ZLR0_9RHOD|mmetsp:Transcript_24288/g.95585  ORF Transcript_24288/g.95585 Transcript_24288/m.95585 type:complete len:204 (+) Transcript_24288:166-777(+)|eukprot:CAMPEP_0113956798 /NCGR_PEP_ID=MMETSP0011_2-20120614/2301_1 /TAXON_ID=101924 /ORGANISM="Rhodosorus marinus" /LENGTH=203 /DNA_ID=CAMNT_0000967063 /DNA_START=122 /DNA_END=733 /DNA_ORIENTATION=+ /assembly_acc=CAM_ASM_000156
MAEAGFGGGKSPPRLSKKKEIESSLHDLETDLEGLDLGPEPKRDSIDDLLDAGRDDLPAVAESDDLADLEFDVDAVKAYTPNPSTAETPTHKKIVDSEGRANLDHLKVGTVNMDAFEDDNTDLNEEIRKNLLAKSTPRPAEDRYENSQLHKDVGMAKERLVQRGEKLNSTLNSTEAMAESSAQFSNSATKLKEKMQKKKWYQF